MTVPLEKLQNLVFSHFSLSISNLHDDLECTEYSGFNFNLNNFPVKFRKSKITPTKTGQFVTLWKRNSETKETEPFTSQDLFTFYIILTETSENCGFFFFTRDALIKNQIISTENKSGKRGFRVYTAWDHLESRQALKAQNWQTHFFIDFANENYLSKFETILKSQF